MLLSTRQLEQFTIGATDGDIGRVTDLYFEDRQWTVRYLVVETGGWLIGREVLISPAQIRRADTTRGILHALLTRAQVGGSPPVDAKQPVSRQEAALWAGPYRGPAVNPWLILQPDDPIGPQPGGATEELLARERSEPDPHLRSAHDVRGHRIQARDGGLGHVEDYLVDDRHWIIRWVIVDTQNWWPGKHVLVSPQWIDRVSWDASAVFVDLLRGQIQTAPEYDLSLPVDREFESRLVAHYGRPGYWEEAGRAA